MALELFAKKFMDTTSMLYKRAVAGELNKMGKFDTRPVESRLLFVVWALVLVSTWLLYQGYVPYWRRELQYVRSIKWKWRDDDDVTALVSHSFIHLRIYIYIYTQASDTRICSTAPSQRLPKPWNWPTLILSWDACAD